MTSIRIYALVAALVVALTLGLGYALWQLAGAHQELSHTQGRVEALEASVEALEARSQGIAKAVQSLSNRSQKTDADLKAILAKEPEWGAAAVPPAVADGVCQFARCAAPGGPVRAP